MILAHEECHGVAVVNDTEETLGASPDIPREKSQRNGLDTPKIVNPSSSQKQDDAIPWNGLDPPQTASVLVDRESIPWNGLDPPTPVRAVKPVGSTVCELSCSNNKEKQEQESCAAFTVNILVGDRSVDAIVDTAAEVTVISEDLFHSLSPRPSIIGKRHLNMAGKNQSSKAKLAGPVHIRLRPLPDESKRGLNDEQVGKLEQLLSTYQDVFAKSDFDLGDFTAVSHSIYRGHAAPIKQGLRRTPLHFRGEEDGHLNKMLTAGDPTRA